MTYTRDLSAMSYDDILNTHDLRTRLGQLAGDDDEDAIEEREAIEEILEETDPNNYGNVLIRDSYFERHAQETAEDCGMISDTNQWPNYCIDWEWAARELKGDYSSIEVDGEDYWYREA